MKVLVQEKPEDKRIKEINELFQVTHIIGILVILIALASLNNFKLGEDYFSNFFVGGLFIFIILGLIPYILTKFATETNLISRFCSSDMILLFILFPLVAVITYHTGGFSGVKVLFLVPVLMAAISYGRLFGVSCAAMAGLFLLITDFKQIFTASISGVFQLDLILASLTVLLAWLIGGLADIERRDRERLLFMANTDGLTGLYNHRYFQERLAQELQKAKANSAPLSLVLMDIDYFKFYNDTFGHQKGDELLVIMGRLFQELVKEPSFVARYGGEEFALILPSVPKEIATKEGSKIQEEIEAYPFEGAEIQPAGKITLSFGVASYPEDADTPGELVDIADKALYQAKYSRNKVHLYFSVVEHLSSINRSEQELFSSLKTLLTVINAKDRYTFGHSERVMAYANALAEKLGLSMERKSLLKYGAYLHDIGKVEVEPDILNKPGPLTEEEWDVIKHHPVWGSDIVRPLVSLLGLVSLIRHHHENYDGSGYPDGLDGEDIPLEARILRVVDSFDAMTTDRPYKKAKEPLEACAELKRGAGRMYDPVVVNAFVDMIMESQVKIKEND